MPSMFDPVYHAHKKGISVEEASEIIKSWRPTNIQYWLKKTNGNSELAKELWMNHQNKGMKTRLKNKDKMKSENPRSLTYWMQRHGMTESEAKIEVSKVQSLNNLERYVKKYGQEEGTKKFKERQTKWQNTIQSKPQDQLIAMNRSKAVNHKQKLDELGVDEYLKMVRKPWAPLYEFDDNDFTTKCSIIKKFRSQFKEAAINGHVCETLLQQLIDEISQHGIMTRFEQYIPYYSVFRVRGIDLVGQIRQKIYPEAYYKKSGRGYKVFYKGIVFDSKTEFGLYQYLLTQNIEIEKSKSRLKYPEGSYYFDFYLPTFNLYVECTGMMKLSWYRSKIEKKKLIVQNHNIKCIFVSSLEELKRELCQLNSNH